jgi:hypothetical protein
MAELNWNILAQPDFAGDALKYQQAGQQQRLSNRRSNILANYGSDPQGSIKSLAEIDPTAASALAKFGESQAQGQARKSAGAMYAAGDSAGARKTAIASGDADFADAIGKMDADQIAESARRFERLATVGLGLKRYPYDQRQSQLQKMTPMLSSLGLKPEDISSIDPTDQGIDGFVSTVMGFKDALAASKPEIRNSGEEVLTIDPMTGNVINRARGARTVSVGADTSLYELPGTGGMETPANPTQTVLPTQPAQQDLAGGPDLSKVDGLLSQTGGQVTSRTRTPERNAQVGGVENSYHLTGQARDAVPPQGMSTAQYAATLKGQLPGWDVIDEGDHVHVEPGPGMGARKPAEPYQVASMGQTPPRAQNNGPAAPPAPEGGPRLLVQRPKAPKEQVRTLSAQEAVSLGYPAGTIVQEDAQGRRSSSYTPPSTSQKITEDMRKTANYAFRMGGANDQMNTLYDQGIVKPTAQVLVSESNGVARLVARNPKDALYVQAAQEWIMAKLRKESGAAIGASELSNDLQTFFPEPSDSPELISQKARSRERVMKGFLNEGRLAYEESYGKAPEEFKSRSPATAKAKPPAGAREGRNGKFYIPDPNKPGSFPEVRKAPDGKWYFRSGNDFYRVAD